MMKAFVYDGPGKCGVLNGKVAPGVIVGIVGSGAIALAREVKPA